MRVPNSTAVVKLSFFLLFFLFFSHSPIASNAYGITVKHKCQSDPDVYISNIKSTENEVILTFEFESNKRGVCWHKGGANAPFLLTNDKKRHRLVGYENVSFCPERKNYKSGESFKLGFEALTKDVNEFSLYEGESGLKNNRGYWNFIKVPLELDIQKKLNSIPPKQNANKTDHLVQKTGTHSPFDGIKPQQLYVPEEITFGASTTRTQAELDRALIKQVTSDKYCKYKNQGNYKKVAKIISEGAYISDEALFSSITKRNGNDSGKDYKSLQLMYLNGEFEPDIFKQLSCYDLGKAVTPEIRTSGTNKANAHTSAEQVALFLSDKVSFRKCDKLLPNVLIPEYLDQINLNIAKLLIEQNVDTKSVFDMAIAKVFADDLYSFNNEVQEESRKRLAQRHKVVQFLIDSGVKPHEKHLEMLFRNYLKRSHHYTDIPVQNMLLTQLTQVAKLLITSGVQLNESTKELISKYREKVDGYKDSLERKNYSSKKDRKKLEHAIKLYPKTMAVFKVPGTADVNTVVQEHSLTKQLHEAVVAGDKRRVKFYLKKGAKGNLATLRKAIAKGMDTVAISILGQNLDYDPYIIAALAIKHKSPTIVDFLLKTKDDFSMGEDLVVLAAEKRMDNTVKNLMKKGVNPVKAIKLSLEKHGSDYPSVIIAGAGNEQSKTIFKEYKKEDERKTAIARRKAEEERLAREKEEQQKREEVRQQYLARKQKGDMVCKDGRMAIFLNITIKAFVEDTAGNTIKIRIADTEGTSPNYNGVTLNQNTIIWDDYQEWRKCN